MQPSQKVTTPESSQRSSGTSTAKFPLELTADEIEWLLFEALPLAQKKYADLDQRSAAVEVAYTRDCWQSELMKAGWRPF